MGVPTYRLQARRARHLVRAGRHRRRHPRAVRVVRHGERHVQHHRAADRDTDERARRHAALGGTRDRRHGDHDPALRDDRGRAGDRRQGGDRRGPGRRRAVHAERRAGTGVRTAAAAGPPTRSPGAVTPPGAARSAATPRGEQARPHAARGATLLARARPAQVVQGRARARRRRPRRARGRDPRRARAERLRQVDADQRRQRTLPRRRGQRAPSRASTSRRWPAHRIARAGISRTYQIPRPFAHSRPCATTSRSRRCSAAAALDRAARGRRRAALAAVHRPADTTPTRIRASSTCIRRSSSSLRAASRAAPRLLMLDEVLSGLTPTEIDEAVDLIRRIRDQGTTIVLVEHVMRVVTALSDRIVVLDQGRVLAEGECGRRDGAQGSRDRVPRGCACLRYATSTSTYGAAPALWGASLRLAAGELVCVLGPNGAGKTTLINAIAGPASGERRPHRDGRPRPDHAAAASLLQRGHRDRARRPPPLHPDERAREPRDRRLRAGAREKNGRARWTASARSSRRFATSSTRPPARCPAASSRWSRSAAR